jgi:galactosylxylosylprotein 3-beta-galactosyltransferase
MPKLKFSNSRKSSKVLQMLSAFLLGIVISQLFTSSLLTFEKREIIDDKNYFLVILVLTSPTNFERRLAMRETWLNLRPREVNENYELIVSINGSDSLEIQKKNLENFKQFLNVKNEKNLKLLNYKIKTFFSVGTLDIDQKIKSELINEQEVYHDLLILEDLKDSYQNLTLKLMKSIKKINEVLPNFKYLIKVYDDTYVKQYY